MSVVVSKAQMTAAGNGDPERAARLFAAMPGVEVQDMIDDNWYVTVNRDLEVKMFDTTTEYVVANCDVSDWSHAVWFEGVEGRWNGVMFSYVDAARRPEVATVVDGSPSVAERHVAALRKIAEIAPDGGRDPVRAEIAAIVREALGEQRS